MPIARKTAFGIPLLILVIDFDFTIAKSKERFPVILKPFMIHPRSRWTAPLIDVQLVFVEAAVSANVEGEPLLRNILPNRAGPPSKAVFAIKTARGEISQQRKNIENGRLSGTVTADQQLLAIRLKLEVHQATVVRYIKAF